MIFRATAGLQLVSSSMVAFGIAYSDLVGLSYVALSCAMACKVFRMVLLCKNLGGPQDIEMVESTAQETSLGAPTVREQCDHGKLSV